MTDEVLFAGGRLDSVRIIGGVVVESTITSRFETQYSDIALATSNFDDRFEFGLFTQTAGVLAPTTIVSGETFWCHFRILHESLDNGFPPGIRILDNARNPWIRFAKSSGNITSILFNSGTVAAPVWTIIASMPHLAANIQFDMDIEVVIGSPNTVRIYQNNSLVLSGTFTQALFTNIGFADFGTLYRAGYSVFYSQLLATRNISTIAAKVKTCRATGAGANTGWSGTFASVNEVVGSDATIQSAVTAGLKSTHAMGDVTVPNGFEIKSIFHWVRAKNDGTAPNNIKSVLRLSGVDYSTGNLSGINPGYTPVGARYDTDPLGSNWTQAIWNSIEAGYEAAT